MSEQWNHHLVSHISSQTLLTVCSLQKDTNMSHDQYVHVKKDYEG